MTAAELIAELQKLPPETPVVVRGEDGGYWPTDSLRVLTVYDAGEGGEPFEDAEVWPSAAEGKPQCRAACLE